MSKVFIYDTTLRDGTQREGISLSLEDKLKIAKKLDEFGIDYIEGGWPGSNPKDMAFFERAPELELEQAKVVAFGSTRRAGVTTEADANIQALVAAMAPVAITLMLGIYWLQRLFGEYQAGRFFSDGTMRCSKRHSHGS